MIAKLTGLVAATHTPFNASGDLNLAIVEKQAAHLIANGVIAAFVGGTTGESSSLSTDERLALATRWSEVVRGSPLKLIVHVGGNSVADSRKLAAHAQSVGAAAISALSPSYFKPATLDLLIACTAEISNAAPALPFYFYDIPIMTGVKFSMPDFLNRAGKSIPNLAGIKFTNPDMMAFQQCLHVKDGRFDIPWGCDEYFLAALALGAVGGVGSTYNFAAPIYQRLISAFKRGDIAAARVEQFRSVRLVDLLASQGYMGAAKSVMTVLGIDVGPARLPAGNLSVEQRTQLQRSLDEMGFFSWLR
jgi:N-acetylneuraminate lyase